MKQIIASSNIFAIIVIFAICCIRVGYAETNSTFDLPVPKWIPIGKSTISTTIFDGENSKITNRMLKQITINCGNKNLVCTPRQKERYLFAVHAAIEFLATEFGSGRYKKNIDLIVTRDPKINGTMLWKRKNQKKRIVYINEINLEETEWRILVHELFHAYYQTDNFIIHHPDFVNEGLAVYAEYKYRYPNKKNSEIAKIMRSHAEALGYPSQPYYLNYELSFSSYEGRILDLIYIISGLFFMDQDSDFFTAKAPEILDNKNNNDQSSFKQFIKNYGLVANEYASLPSPLMPAVNVINREHPEKELENIDICTRLTKFAKKMHLSINVNGCQ